MSSLLRNGVEQCGWRGFPLLLRYGYGRQVDQFGGNPFLTGPRTRRMGCVGRHFHEIGEEHCLDAFFKKGDELLTIRTHLPLPVVGLESCHLTCNRQTHITRPRAPGSVSLHTLSIRESNPQTSSPISSAKSLIFLLMVARVGSTVSAESVAISSASGSISFLPHLHICAEYKQQVLQNTAHCRETPQLDRQFTKSYTSCIVRPVVRVLGLIEIEHFLRDNVQCLLKCFRPVLVTPI